VSNSNSRFLLFPFALFYGIGVWFRNQLFNAGILSAKSFNMPVISIGNITVGGTGKTPHTEFLIRSLSKEFQVAVLSRGYKRKSKGFVMAQKDSTLAEIGDEPLQMKLKFPELVVAVDENRRRGIANLMDPGQQPFVEVILLDDAFQHRHVNPSISILLIDYNRLLCDDFLMPVGNLREPAGQMKRAQIVVVTKCPEKMSPMDVRLLSKNIDTLPYQSLFYTTMRYSALVKLGKETTPLATSVPGGTPSMDLPVENMADILPLNLTFNQILESKQPVLILSGIATPENFIDQIRQYAPDAKAVIFADHHEFGKRDARKIAQEFEKIKDANGIIITTEKDATRIRNNAWMEVLTPYIYYPTLEVHFLEEQGKSFEQKILDYVRINKRNRKLS
jgi:tetraacyldisaccharide 4'-kinase